MRSSKSRSRSKSNRNRSVGNVVNRVFDSSGPEGKVRGTPQQIIDKYNQLARDAQLSNDRVAAENFQQHAEHYLRMLAEAQKEQAERQQQQQQQQQNRQQQGSQNQNGQQQNNRQQAADDVREPGAEQPQERPEQKKAEAVDVIDPTDEKSGLVETPESKSARPRRSRKKPDADPQPETAEQPATPDAAE